MAEKNSTPRSSRPHSREATGTPSKPGTPSQEPRRVRRKKKEKEQEREEKRGERERERGDDRDPTGAVAGPGPSTLSKVSSSAGEKKRKSRASTPRKEALVIEPKTSEVGFAEGYDFLAFDEDSGFEDGVKKGDERDSRDGRGKEKDRPSEREWDKGKERMQDWDRDRDRNRGDARRSRRDEYDRNDGYANKKQRLDAASRKAPWIADVTWEGCTNVAEMSV